MNEHDYALRDAAMAEFVDSYFKARPQLLRTRHEECLVEAGFKAAWKPDQTERAEKAESELAKLREQKPAGYVFGDWRGATTISAVKSSHFNTPLYAEPIPVPAPAVPYGIDEEAANRIALAVYDCKNGINPEPLLYVINRILAAEAHPLSVEGKRALLQSSEVTK